MNNQFLTVAFYNTENFYSDITSDVHYLPSNFKKWQDDRYAQKVKHIAYAISKIGHLETKLLPAIVGLSEIENKKVLEDLRADESLVEGMYDSIIYPSLDERNSNVALLYQPALFEIEQSKPLRIVFKNSHGEKSYTRDVLYVKGKLVAQQIHLFIVHLPSKLDGEINQHKRRLILENIRKQCSKLLTEDPLAKILIMGDFNDTPTNEILRVTMDTRANKNETDQQSFFNPMVKMMSYSYGTLVHKKQWMLFDQMLFSKGLLGENSPLSHFTTNIYMPSFLKNNAVKMGGAPYRTFVGSKYLGGYSDHFPIYTIIKY